MICQALNNLLAIKRVHLAGWQAQKRSADTQQVKHFRNAKKEHSDFREVVMMSLSFLPASINLTAIVYRELH